MKTKHKPEPYKSQVLNDLFNEIDPEELEKTRKRMQLAARIADGISARNWTKKQFAEKMKVAPSVVSRWLSGTHNFESDTLFDIEAVLGIGIIQLETT
jgi:ribosome-binding protein aMBF1 (putative translation factor)